MLNSNISFNEDVLLQGSDVLLLLTHLLSVLPSGDLTLHLLWALPAISANKVIGR